MPHGSVGLWLALILVVSAIDTQGAPKWLRIRTPHFVLIGDAGEGSIRQVAQRVETFREALLRTLPGATVASPVPTVIIVFGSDEAFTPIKPLFQGKPIRLAGYYQPGEDVNYIALNAATGLEAYNVVFHEYAHALINNTLQSVPVWVNEGLAEFYRTFEEHDGGRGALIGRAPAEHVVALRAQPFMPLAELMAVDHDSRVYNEGDRRGIFYAESWALMHYLQMANDSRRSQLRQFMLDVSGGTDSAEAFRRAFQVEPSVVEAEVREYVRRFTFPAQTIAFVDSTRQATPARAEAISDGEAQAYFGDVLTHMGRVDEAASRFERLLKAEPMNARALVGLGVVHMRGHRLDEALPLLERATTIDPKDPAILASFGEALVSRVQEAGGRDDAGVIVAKARTILEQAAALQGDNAHVSALRGYVEMAAGDHLDDARAFLDRAIKLAPTREPYRLMLANVYLRQNDHAAATAQLGQLLAHGSRPEIKEQARAMLRRAADERARALRRPETPTDDSIASSGNPPDGRPAASSVAAPASTGPIPSTAPTHARFAPDLRPLKEGEIRVLGEFKAIECLPGRITLTVKLPERDLRIVAASFDTISFITYRQDIQMRVACGAIEPALRALATYRAPADPDALNALDGQAVAIEIVPTGYVLSAR